MFRYSQADPDVLCVEQGVEQKNLSLAKMMLEDKEPIDKIKKYTGFATDKLEEIAKSMGMTFTA